MTQESETLANILMRKATDTGQVMAWGTALELAGWVIGAGYHRDAEPNKDLPDAHFRERKMMADESKKIHSISPTLTLISDEDKDRIARKDWSSGSRAGRAFRRGLEQGAQAQLKADQNKMTTQEEGR